MTFELSFFNTPYEALPKDSSKNILAEIGLNV